MFAAVVRVVQARCLVHVRCNISRVPRLRSRVRKAGLRVPRGTSVRTVLVYDGTIAPEVEENGYFDYLVPVESFFN